MNSTIDYLQNVLDELEKKWPDNRVINIVCHGHSVPAGYFATPFVNTFHAYPHLLHRILKERFPFAIINVIVTGIGGETSANGALRFEKDVLTHHPDVITIDYGLNDRTIGLENSKTAWESMIVSALSKKIKVILLTPTWDQSYYAQDENWEALVAHKNQIISLAQKYQIGLADSFSAFSNYVAQTNDLTALLSHVNHPTHKGHELVANELGKFFLAR